MKSRIECISRNVGLVDSVPVQVDGVPASKWIGRLKCLQSNQCFEIDEAEWSID